MSTVAQPQSHHKPTFTDGYVAGIRGAALEEMTTAREVEGWWATRRTQGDIENTLPASRPEMKVEDDGDILWA